MKELTREELMCVAASGQSYALGSMTEECLAQLTARVDGSNAKEIFEFASKYNFDDLKAKCQKLM